MRILITGANGHLGRRLINALDDDVFIEAMVRSEQARQTLLRYARKRTRLTITRANPLDTSAIAQLARQCDCVIHLIGTIKSVRHNRLIDSHERPATALINAVAASAVKKIIYLSILGASSSATSQCLRSRFAVETILSESVAVSTTIRVPMVLGEMDRASFALAKRASKKRIVVFRGASLEQPIYAGDVIDALLGALTLEQSGNRVFQLAGPESLSRIDLLRRAASLNGRTPAIISLPLACGRAFAAYCEWTMSKPPITRDMLSVLDHDDAINPASAAAELGVKLTSLDDMLEQTVRNRLN